jgi:hypothetical protein
VTARAISDRPWKGIDFLTLEEAGVTFTESGLVVVPYRLPDGTEHNRRVFALSGRCWWETPGVSLIPFGLETIPANKTDWALLLCEGESDTLACREAFAGVSAGHHLRGFVVLGMPGAATWQHDWNRYVEGFDLIYAIGDGDEPGRKLACAIKRSLPWARPVHLPEGADARGLLQVAGGRALDDYLIAADNDAVQMAAFWLAGDVDDFQTLRREPHYGLTAPGVCGGEPLAA